MYVYGGCCVICAAITGQIEQWPRWCWSCEWVIQVVCFVLFCFVYLHMLCRLGVSEIKQLSRKGGLPSLVFPGRRVSGADNVFLDTLLREAGASRRDGGGRPRGWGVALPRAALGWFIHRPGAGPGSAASALVNALRATPHSRYGMVRDGTVRYGTVRYRTVRYGAKSTGYSSYCLFR